MQIDIMVQQTITVPDESLLELAAAIRKKWETADALPVTEEDILTEAIAQDLISDPGDWTTNDGTEWTDEELKKAFPDCDPAKKPAKKPAKQRKKK